jgi:O-antigen ligase
MGVTSANGQVNVILNNISLVLIALYFVISFCVYPGIFPERGMIMTALALIICILEVPKQIIVRRQFATNQLFMILLLQIVSNVLMLDCTISQLVLAVQYCALIGVMLILCRSEQNKERIIKIIAWTSFIGGPLIGLIQLRQGAYLFGPTPPGVDPSTIISTATQVNSNYAATTMLLSAMLSGYLYAKYKKTIYAFLFLVSSICIVLTFSRTTIAIYIISIVIYLLIKAKRGGSFKGNTFIRAAVSLLLLLAIAVLFYDAILNCIETYLMQSDIDKVMRLKTDYDVLSRFGQWGASIQIVISNGPIRFLFGFGDSASQYMGQVTGNVMSAHNVIFGCLAEGGVIGLILIVLLYFNCIRKTIRCRKELGLADWWLIICSHAMLVSFLMIANINTEFIITIVLMDLMFLKCGKNRLIAAQSGVAL